MSWPLQNIFLTSRVIHEATMTNSVDDEKRIFFIAFDKTIKERYGNHTRDFNHECHSKCKELSKYSPHQLPQIHKLKRFIFKTFPGKHLRRNWV